MSQPHNVVSLHPYFKVESGKLDKALALLPIFVSRTQTEKDCLYYDFTLDGDVVHCREAYRGAKGVEAHLDNVAEQLGEMLSHSELLRLEIHGPAAELDQLCTRCAPLNPAWFVHQCGVTK